MRSQTGNDTRNSNNVHSGEEECAGSQERRLVGVAMEIFKENAAIEQNLVTA